MRSIKILGHLYEVRDDHAVRVEDESCGQCCMAGLWIRLDPSAPPSRYEEAFLHEVIEALNFHLQLKLEHPILSALSEGLFQVLSENGMKTGWKSA